MRSSLAGSPISVRSAVASASGSPGGTSSAPATSGKPPTRVSSSGFANAIAVNSTPDWSISRYGSTTRSAARKAPASSAFDTKRSAVRTFGPWMNDGSMRGMPTTHSSASSSSAARHASSRTSRPLYGRISPKNSTTGLVFANGGVGVLGHEVVEHAVRDHVHLRGVDPDLVTQPPGAVLGVHDHRVHPLVERTLAGQLGRLRLARQHVVGGQHARSPRRQQARVERLDREPLEVHDVGLPRGAAVAQHVRHVLREPRMTRAPRAGAQR